MEPATDTWRPSRRFFFRFFFIFLGSSTMICWDNIGDMIHRTFSTAQYNFDAFYGFLHAPVHWLDVHLFHTGYDPKTQQPFPGDNHFGVLFYLLLLLIALIGAVIWSVLDRKRPDYNRLRYWFSLYLRYMLAITLFTYGFDKLIPVQMIFPNIENLLRPMGESNRFLTLWNFMGVAPGYQMVTGTTEIIAALLLFNRWTIALGCIVALVVLINVVSLNIFYNVVVKLFSMQLLFYTLYLPYPYLRRLLRLFFTGQSVSLAMKNYRFHTPWKKYALTFALMGIPLLLLTIGGVGITQRYHRHAVNARLQKYYEVNTFVAKDTLPPLLTDTLRWKRLLISYSAYTPMPYAVVSSMQDDQDFYYFEIDSAKKTFTLKDPDDSLHRHVFSYSNPAPPGGGGRSQMLLTGDWKGKNVQILMNDIPIDSMRLVKEQIRMIRD
jgi:hypothetical protein